MKFYLLENAVASRAYAEFEAATPKQWRNSIAGIAPEYREQQFVVAAEIFSKPVCLIGISSSGAPGDVLTQAGVKGAALAAITWPIVVGAVERTYNYHAQLDALTDFASTNQKPVLYSVDCDE